MEDEAVSASRVVVVLPTLNESKAVGKVVGKMNGALKGYDYHVLVVDGHSVDGTDRIAEDMGAEVIYQRGKGYGDALRTGFEYARNTLDAEVIVMMDADMTYDPVHIPSLLKPILNDEADMVLGNRFAGMEKGAMPLVNRLGNSILSLVAKLALGLKVFDTQSGMRAFRSSLLDRLGLRAVGMPFAMEMLSDAKGAGARVSEVPISYRARVGETKLNPIKDGGRILGITVRLMFDVRPLLLFGGIGAILGLFGMLLHYMAMSGEIGYLLFMYIFSLGLIMFGCGFALAAFKSLRKRKWRSGRHE